MLAVLLFAESSASGSYGGPVIVPTSSAMSVALTGLPHEFPERTKTARSATNPLVLYTTLSMIWPVEFGFR